MKHNQMRQVVFPILAAFIWGTAFVAQDMCADAIGAFAFNASRYFIAVLALLLRRVVRHPLGVAACFLVVAGGLGNIIENYELLEHLGRTCFLKPF